MESDIDISTKINARQIQEDFGINLLWSEYVALRHYVKSFSNKEEQGLDLMLDSNTQFMSDYFGMDIRDLGYRTVWDPKRRVKFGLPRLKKYGMNLLGDERFKEYCRRYVTMWRDERTLI